VPASAISKFEKAIAQHSGKVNFRDFTDDYANRLEKLVERKRSHGGEIVSAPVGEAASAEPGGGEVIDLLQVLRQSLGGQKPAARKAAHKAPRKTASKSSKPTSSRKRSASRKSGKKRRA
jgi:DNA end-binding protein Ku